MLKSVLMCAALTMVAVSPGSGQQKARRQPASPPADTSVTIGGKTLTIKYSAPSVKGRKIFGEGGRVSQDPTYPVWRLGANAATAFHTDADLDIGPAAGPAMGTIGLFVPKGDYTLFALVNVDPWRLIVSKATGEWGLAYAQDQDLGRVKMDMSKPPAPIETLKITLSGTGGNKGKLLVEWENVVASVPFTVK
jgi:hypothetical protein